MSRGQIVIERQVEEVFDVVADESRPFDPRIVRAEKVTPGPIGLHTVFRSKAKGRFGTVPMTVELTRYERPRRLDSRTSLAGMEIESALTFEAHNGGTRLTWSSHATPHGLLRVLAPFVDLLAVRQERRVWTELKHAMESDRERGPL